MLADLPDDLDTDFLAIDDEADFLAIDDADAAAGNAGLEI
jgi:hypothetical protein